MNKIIETKEFWETSQYRVVDLTRTPFKTYCVEKQNSKGEWENMGGGIYYSHLSSAKYAVFMDINKEIEFDKKMHSHMDSPDYYDNCTCRQKEWDGHH